MRDRIVRAAARRLTPLLGLFALFLLSRGHNAPGGGFVAGLVAAGALAFHALAFDAEAARGLLRVDPRRLAAAGVLVAALAAVLPLAYGDPLLASRFLEVPLPLVGSIEVGTPLVFDVGVLATVLGTTTGIVCALEEA